jgi:hypothetical protein
VGRHVPSWDEIPEGRDALPGGNYLVEIESIDEKRTAEKNKIAYQATYRVAEGLFAGTMLWEWHNIGSDADPEADDPRTMKEAIGTKTLKQLFKAANVPLSTTDISVMAANARGARFVQAVGQKVEPANRPDGTANKYAGRISQTFIRKYRVGEAATEAPADSGAESGRLRSRLSE